MGSEGAAVESGQSGANKGGKARARSGSFGWEALTVAMSRFIVKGGGFISSLIIARLLGPEGRGLVSALTVPSQLAITISELGIRQSAAFHLGRGIFSIERLLPTLLAMVPMASAIGIAAALIYFEVSGVAEGDWLLRGLAVALIPLALVISYATGVFLGQQRIAAFRRASWRPAVVSLLLLIVLGWFAGLGIYGAMIAPLGGALVGCVYALYLLRKEAPLQLGFDREVASKLQAKGISYAASFIVLTLNYRIMILLLTQFSTLDQVGIYAQAIAVAELIWEVPQALGALVLSRAVNAQEQREFSRKVMVLARICFLAAVAISLGIAIVAPYFFPLVFGRGFADSAWVCIILLPGVVAFIVFKMLSIDLAGRGKPWATMIIMVPILFLNLGLGWWMIERDGAIGAAWASSICYIIATIGYIFLYSRMVGAPLREILLFRRSDFAQLLRALPLRRKR